MIKNLLRLLAVSTSFVALVLLTNPAMAASQIDNSLAQTVAHQPVLQQVSLNVISPSLESITQENDSPIAHLGCSCAVCTQAVEQTSKII